jgi:D-alanyl-D-alanine carboxypeptidase/D-alanyl-D-alanine-endopeptidase (penicillin-binding protein 4)
MRPATARCAAAVRQIAARAALVWQIVVRAALVQRIAASAALIPRIAVRAVAAGVAALTAITGIAAVAAVAGFAAVSSGFVEAAASAATAGANARPAHTAPRQPAPPSAVGVPASGATPLQLAVGIEVARTMRDTAAVGVHVLEVASGDTIYSYNGDDPRVTASNTKLFTTAAALDAFGPGSLFETRLLLRGAIDEGVLRGDLGVVGGGDPSIDGRASDGDSFAVFRGWAHDLAARGIRRVNGDLYLDAGLFEPRQIHPDWPPAQLASWYEAPVAALSFNDNCALVRIWPSAGGGRARIEIEPPVPLFQIHNTATTSGSRRHNHLSVVRHEDQLVVSGSIYRQSGPLEVFVTVPDAVQYFGLGLTAALAQEGIDVRGRLRPVPRLPGPVWERVAVYRSSLLDAIRIANKRSQNFYAESLLKLLGARRCGDGSWSKGTQAVGEFLVGLGVPTGSFRMVDGSGLSRQNGFTPRALTQLLRHMWFHRAGAEFVQSLPSAGELEGSLHTRMTMPPYRGNVFAKTGTIEGVSALSGYARALSGKVYAFSVLINSSRDIYRSRQQQDRIVMALVDHG